MQSRIFLGDNGTQDTVVSQFQGSSYRGGKRTTNQRGTRVPLIVSWPGVVTAGGVNSDLISSVDFLPTICQAAHANVPAKCDGVSFLPQLRGEAASPREWLYSWYSPRRRRDFSVTEFAFDHDYKLYQNGHLFDLTDDPFEESPLDRDSLDESAQVALRKLQTVLDRFQGERPEALDRLGAASVNTTNKE